MFYVNMTNGEIKRIFGSFHRFVEKVNEAVYDLVRAYEAELVIDDFFKYEEHFNSRHYEFMDGDLYVVGSCVYLNKNQIVSIEEPIFTLDEPDLESYLSKRGYTLVDGRLQQFRE